MTVLRKDIQKAAEKIADEWGFSSVDDFINEAVEERIIELKKHEFVERTDKIKEELKKKGLSGKDVLKDFEERRSSS
ncbi:MAG: hypothetical protein ACQESD_06920 [Thermoplasmatota archaeon]